MDCVPKAGENIQQLAWVRKSDALRLFIIAVCIISVTCTLRISGASALGSLLALAGAGFFAYQGKQQLDRASRADQGARGEEEIAPLLKKLPTGWRFEYNRPIQGVGDIDVILHAPSGRTYAIDVTSHKGAIFQQGDRLKKRMGKNVYPLDKDFIGAALTKASHLQKSEKLGWVTPVICFSAAQVNISRPVQGVYVVEKSQLLKFLLSR